MKWEYKVARIDTDMLSHTDLQEILNDHGMDGWALAAIDCNDKLIFRRPAVPTDVPREVASEKAAVSPQAASPEAQETEALPCPK